MARKVDFRNYCDSLGSGICDYVFDLLLTVPVSLSIRCGVIILASADVADDSLVSD